MDYLLPIASIVLVSAIALAGEVRDRKKFVGRKRPTKGGIPRQRNRHDING